MASTSASRCEPKARAGCCIWISSGFTQIPPDFSLCGATPLPRRHGSRIDPEAGAACAGLQFDGAVDRVLVEPRIDPRHAGAQLGPVGVHAAGVDLADHAAVLVLLVEGHGDDFT